MPLSDYDYGEHVGQVRQVIFGILSPERIKQKSVCKIYKNVTNSGDKEGTLWDPKMGPTERGNICPTCHYTYIDCPGHFGYLNLTKPVYHPQYYSIIISLLGCFCHRCSCILVDKYDSGKLNLIINKGKNRLNALLHRTEKDKGLFSYTCPNCGAQQPKKITKEKDGIMNIMVIYEIDKKQIRTLYNPEIVFNIFKNITDQDLEILGMNPKYCRPDWMIWTVMPIPPPAMRPTVKDDATGRVGFDDLTTKLNDVIKFNNILMNKLSESTGNIKGNLIIDCWQLLQYHVATYIDNEISNLPKAQQRSGRPLKTLRERIKAKDGRVRSNLMGKRVNGSARSVITADPYLSMDQLGVPKKIAMNLTYPELVTTFNLSQMKLMAHNGADVYPGVKNIKKKDQPGRCNLKIVKPEKRHEIAENLQLGDIVYRHLLDNDWVLFNRQPSLHKMSMMAHRVKALEGNTFRLNVNVCAPYNADFDGDEMNMHVPMTLESVVELRMLVAVPTQIVSPQASKPVMGFVQDSLLGSYLLTQQKDLNLRQVMKLIGSIAVIGSELPKPSYISKSDNQPRWSSQQILSLFLPKITYNKSPNKQDKPLIMSQQYFRETFDRLKDSAYKNTREKVEDVWKMWKTLPEDVKSAYLSDTSSPKITNLPADLIECGLIVTDDHKIAQINTDIANQEKMGKIEILGGHMTMGILDSNTVGKKNNSLFHITWNDYGPKATRDLFNDLAFTANTWLQIQGFSCGLSDCVIAQKDHDAISKHINDTRKTVADLIQCATLGTNLPKGETPYTFKTDYPKKIIEVMGKCRGCVEEQTSQSISPNNSIDIMVRCGSKGNKNNLSQIVGMLGQQEIETTWIGDQIYRRTMPHFHKDDLRPEAHGFIENSFMSGLNPVEYWFHAQEGRVGIITKSIKTAETGYIQRKLIKALEDIRVCYDGTVRNANNMLIQCVYGGDGFDASFLETQSMFFLNYGMDRMTHEFGYSINDDIRKYLTPQARHEFEKSDHRSLDTEFETIVYYHQYLKNNVSARLLQPETRSPINFKRMIINTCQQFGLTNLVLADIDPCYIATQVDKLRKKLVVDRIPSVNFVSTVILNSLMAIYMSSKQLIIKYKFNKVAFDHLVELIYLTFIKSLINPGENVGVVAAQSLGEPTTQMALNTFHYTGQGSKANISRGTPRLRELLSLSKKIKTPSMTIHFHDDFFIQKITDSSTHEVNYERISKIGGDIEYTVLSTILVRIETFYDPDDKHTCISEDQEFIDDYYALLPVTDKSYGQSGKFGWLIRLEFDREIIMKKHLPMFLIQEKIVNFLVKPTQTSDRIEHNVIISDENANKLICRIKINVNEQQGDPIKYLEDIEDRLLKHVINGIQGVDQCLVNTVKKDIVLPNGTVVSPFDDNKNAYEDAQKKYNNIRYILETDGSNLTEVLCLPNIDTFRTVSNDVWEIYKLFGVEAARNCLIQEIIQLLKDNETYIQERHISLLVDVMTNQGTLVSVDRHGVNKTDSGPLHRASFEETTTQLTNASILNEVDLMTGVSGNIMFGQFIPTGTNSFNIGLDIDKIKTQLPATQDTYVKHTTELITEHSSDVCVDHNFEFTFKFNVTL